MSLPTIIRKRQSIVRALGRKGYRDAYVGQHIKRGIAAQVRAMREDRGWTQAELGEQLGRKQPNVARLEDEDYGKYNLGTLAKVASAFDVALVVRFVRFSQLVDYTSNITPDDPRQSASRGTRGSVSLIYETPPGRCRAPERPPSSATRS
jgi:transcriptional regulator with XRE-family HTH domain